MDDERMKRIPVPELIDGAQVLQVAEVGELVPTGRTRHTVAGRVVDGFEALAITRYHGGEGAYLFYCDAEWNCVTDTYHADIASAIEQAEYEFGPVRFTVPLPSGEHS